MDIQSRIEQLIQRIIDGSTDFPEGEIQSRVEALLIHIITNGTHSEQEILEILESLKNGIKYIGQVNYYKDLPTDPEIGHAYTVKYKGESGEVEDGTEYVWGKYDGTNQWIKFGGNTGITGVKIAGTELTPDSEGKVNIPKATVSTFGAIAIGSGLVISDGTLSTRSASPSEIDLRSAQFNQIVPNQLDYAVKAAMTDGVGAAWTDAEKQAGRVRMGAASDPTATQTANTTITLKANDTTVVTGTPTSVSATLTTPTEGIDFIAGLNFKAGTGFALTDTAPTGFAIVWADEPTWTAGSIYEIIYRCLWVKNAADKYIISATYKEVSLS